MKKYYLFIVCVCMDLVAPKWFKIIVRQDNTIRNSMEIHFRFRCFLFLSPNFYSQRICVRFSLVSRYCFTRLLRKFVFFFFHFVKKQQQKFNLIRMRNKSSKIHLVVSLTV